ncbi:superoxide-generating NADPH oxidase flavocytochrome [Tieghemostelium lacteum]|uniref:Superoxide-generating NADPH oxidase flavocytochrome n=1 Tax=Tieghemostelium lacteum TaxID=361077 RepID=A0A151Z8I4_TIELA|nr:superoxide-generating NADPH oxidase flavocytochrome [Tieghemostelium lacteum]|eukprot:KYQ90114.1 superoxide-generating NADPH oxidase flavocytochrome [Tieghemostelium lacteum]
MDLNDYDFDLNLSDFTKLTNTDSEDENNIKEDENVQQVYVDKDISYRNKIVKIREFQYSSTNAGIVWPSAYCMIDYILDNKDKFKDKKILELGSATGYTAIFLKSEGLDITSSDIDNQEITDNILHNQSLNQISFPHIPHTWGTEFPNDNNNFDVIIGSDIIIYVAYLEKLVATLVQIMKPHSIMIMTYKRKIYASQKFFTLLESNGFQYETIGNKTWLIKRMIAV